MPMTGNQAVKYRLTILFLLTLAGIFLVSASNTIFFVALVATVVLFPWHLALDYVRLDVSIPATEPYRRTWTNSYMICGTVLLAEGIRMALRGLATAGYSTISEESIRCLFTIVIGVLFTALAIKLYANAWARLIAKV